MKNLLILLLFVSFEAWSVSGEGMIDISNQFKNRNWNYHASTYARLARLTDYTNAALIEQARQSITPLVNNLNTLSLDVLNSFYPELKLSNNEERVDRKRYYEEIIGTLKFLSGWNDFLTAVDEEKWEDTESSECVYPNIPLENSNCGRKSKGDYALRNLTSEQRENIGLLRDTVIEDLRSIENLEEKIPLGPGIIYVLQFLKDKRSLASLLQEPFLNGSEIEKKKNSIELLRALAIQTFSDRNGEIYNSDLKTISLEKASCLSDNDPLACQFNYFSTLFWDANNEVPSYLARNLILDSKFVNTLLESMVLNFQDIDSESVKEELLKSTSLRIYLAFCSIYGLTPENPSLT